MDKLYCIENKINQHRYVGYTSKTIEDRFYHHKKSANRSNNPIHLAIKKYGPDEFKIYEIYEGYDALQREDEFIKKLKAEYNVAVGGGLPPSQKGKKLSIESRTKISKALVGKKKPNRTIAHRHAISKSKLGLVPWNKGKKGLQKGWNKGVRDSGRTLTWLIKKTSGDVITKNLVLWCEQNGYITNTVKKHYYAKTLPYMDIMSIEVVK